MNTNIGTFSVTDLRHRTSEVLRKVASQGLVYLVRHSRPEAAVIDLDYLEALQEAYEERLDIAEFDKTLKLKRISLDEHKKRRQRLGR